MKKQLYSLHKINVKRKNKILTYLNSHHQQKKKKKGKRIDNFKYCYNFSLKNYYKIWATGFITRCICQHLLWLANYLCIWSHLIQNPFSSSETQIVLYGTGFLQTVKRTVHSERSWTHGRLWHSKHLVARENIFTPLFVRETPFDPTKV